MAVNDVELIGALPDVVEHNKVGRCVIMDALKTQTRIRTCDELRSRL
jgi:hypothetical protein